MLQFSDTGVKAAKRYLSAKSQGEPNTGCILWNGCVDAGGYGLAVISGNQIRAHRLAWIVECGPIPERMKVCHKCDTPACINTKHHFLGTQADNVADMVSKGRQRNRPQFGKDNPMAALTEDQVFEIRHMLTWKRWSQAEISRSYGVSPMTVSRISARKSWPHIQIHTFEKGALHVA